LRAVFAANQRDFHGISAGGADLIAIEECKVMPGETCPLEDGCAGGASPVLRAFGVQLDKDQALRHHKGKSLANLEHKA
tara:strand:+ start:236 stop:472 length:237 start_codon:yes stop_codon:yes gene_type:complete